MNAKTPSEADIRNALKTVKYPGYSRDVVSFGLVKEAGINDGRVSVTLQLTSASAEVAGQIKSDCEQALRALPGVAEVAVRVGQPGERTAGGASGPWAQQNRMPAVRRVVAVASGKGGVGKSTVAVNLACGLRHLGLEVGLLDCDIYGPTHTADDGGATKADHHRGRADDPAGRITG